MADLVARESDVIRTISPNEQMPAEDIEIYLSAGRSALECISLSLHAGQKRPSEVRRILDLPCGHGRVLRYLKAAFPDAEITACDILPDAVDFCASTFGAIPVYSDADPATIPIKDNAFDLIWVGSLFTHLDVDLWSRFLSVFRSFLHPTGVLVFTTHGYDAYRRMVTDNFNYGIPYYRKTAILYNYERHGFGYVKYPGSNSYYGLSLSDPAWVVTHIAKFGGLRIVCFSEKGWVNFHDSFACVRDSDWKESHANVSPYLYLKHKISELIKGLHVPFYRR
ncbi:MAG: class I SAM-dependent methyltransferase [Burkholderiales bacterium]